MEQESLLAHGEDRLSERALKVQWTGDVSGETFMSKSTSVYCQRFVSKFEVFQ